MADCTKSIELGIRAGSLEQACQDAIIAVIIKDVHDVGGSNGIVHNGEPIAIFALPQCCSALLTGDTKDVSLHIFLSGDVEVRGTTPDGTVDVLVYGHCVVGKLTT